MGKPQVNLLLDQEDRDLLDAIAFVGEASATEVLRPVVLRFLAAQRADPDVEAALAALQARRARKAGKLTSLRRKGTRATSA